jgi:hypothetical protein
MQNILLLLEAEKYLDRDGNGLKVGHAILTKPFSSYDQPVWICWVEGEIEMWKYYESDQVQDAFVLVYEPTAI